MPIDPGMLDAAVRISSVTELEGTGFLATVPSETIPGHRWGYVVTAHHVIDKKIEIAVQAPVPYDATGRLYDPVPVPADEWRQPLENVDIAVAPWRPVGTRHPAFPLELMIPTDVVMSMVLGTPVYYIGIFEPLMRPVARSGTVAALDQAGVPHRDYEQLVHLVDCRSYLGFSGSPCLVEFRFAKLEEIPADQLPWGHLPEEMWAGGASVPSSVASRRLCSCAGCSSVTTRTSPVAVSSYGVGVMARSEEIKAVLMSQELREQRREWERELEAE